MQIGPIGSIGFSAYNNQTGPIGFPDDNSRTAAAGRQMAGAAAFGADAPRGMEGPDSAQKDAKPGFKSSPAECETCRERKYIDGSDENVSFKAAAHLSPEAAPAAVRAHEGEHVSNAYTKAAQKGGQVVSASVSIHTAVCPECGRTYVSGGTTNTMIRYKNESNPYQQNRKSADAAALIGRNLDLAV